MDAGDLLGDLEGGSEGTVKLLAMIILGAILWEELHLAHLEHRHKAEVKWVKGQARVKIGVRKRGGEKGAKHRKGNRW